MKTKHYCKFPDETTVELSSVQECEQEVCITYNDENSGIQELWVPKEFIQTSSKES